MKFIPLLAMLSGCSAFTDQDDKIFEVNFRITPTEYGCVVDWNGKEQIVRGTREMSVKR